MRVDGGVGVRAVYDDGNPVSFSDASLFAPAGGPPIFTGMTDRNGCFMFSPDTSGVWRVTVDDGMGHVVTAELPVGGAIATPAADGRRPPKRYGVVAGLAGIFGIFGWWAYLRLKLAGNKVRG